MPYSLILRGDHKELDYYSPLIYVLIYLGIFLSKEPLLVYLNVYNGSDIKTSTCWDEASPYPIRLQVLRAYLGTSLYESTIIVFT